LSTDPPRGQRGREKGGDETVKRNVLGFFEREEEKQVGEHKFRPGHKGYYTDGVSEF